MPLDTIRFVGIECMSLYVRIFVFIFIGVLLRRSAVVEIEEKGASTYVRS